MASDHLIDYRPVPPEEPNHGISNETFHKLWSGPANGEYLSNIKQTDGVYINKTTGNPVEASQIELLRHDTDLYFTAPPAAVGRWNRNDFESLPTGTDEEIVRPTTVETRSSSDPGWIGQAYVELFSVDPSTRLLNSKGNSTLYVSPKSTVRVASDWNDARPSEGTTEYFGDDDEYRITYKDYEKAHRVKIVKGATLHNAPTGYDRKMEFQIPADKRGSYTYGVAVEFKVSMYQHHETEVETPTGTEWVTVSEPSKRYSDTLYIEDVLDVRTYQPNVSALRQPQKSGAAYHVASTKQPVAGVSTPAETYHTNWRYFTARDPSWHNITHVYPVGPDDTEVERYSSNAHPVQTYAYPVPNAGLSTVDSASQLKNALVEYRGDNQSSAPNLTTATTPGSVPGSYPNWPRTWGIDLETVDGTYTTINEFVFTSSDRYDKQIVTGTDSLVVNGIVYNQNHTIPATNITDVAAPETELTATTISQNGSDMRIRFELTTVGGSPIETATTDGHIEVPGSTFDTNASGQAVVTLPLTPATARYQPAPFYSTASPKQASEVHISPSPSIPGVTSTLDNLFTLVLLFGLFFLPLFIVDRILGTDFWPPWKEVWKELF